MDDVSRGNRSVQLSEMIQVKLDHIQRMRSDLDNKRKTIGNSVDEQIAVAELEYRLVKEEMALLGLQEQHWQSAALWDVSHTPDIQKEVCEVLHSYILSVKEKGAIPALHAAEHLALENSVLISSQSDQPSIPKVEWAHHSTDLLVGDRLLEVNGRLVIGKDSTEVSRILNASRPVCRTVFLRPLSLHQLLKNNGCRETSNLRHELTSVVGRLNRKMLENAKLEEQSTRLQNENEDLKNQNRKLKVQVLSLQSVLLYLYQLLERNGCPAAWDSTQAVLFAQCPTVFGASRRTSDRNSVSCSSALRDLLSMNKNSIPWLEAGPNGEVSNKPPNDTNSTENTLDADNR